MTDNKTLTRFFQAKQIPPKLWNFCDQTLQINFILAHVPGTGNPAAEFLSHLDINLQHRFRLKFTDSIPVYRIDIDLAAKTPKQDESEMDWEPEQETSHPKPDDQHHIDAVLQLLTRNYAETDGQFEQRQQQLTNELNHKSKREQHLHYNRFQPHNTLKNPVLSPQRDIGLAYVQRTNPDIQQMIRVLGGDEFPPNLKNFTCQLFQKLTKHKKRFEVVNNSLFRKFYKHLRNQTHKQLVALEATMANIIRTMHRDPMQGHLGSSKMLHALRQRYYSPNLAERFQRFVINCGNCIKAKPYAEHKMEPPLQRIYDPCDGPNDIMENELVGELPNSNGFTHFLKATDIILRYLFAVPLKKPDSHLL